VVLFGLDFFFCALITNKELQYDNFYFSVFVRNYSFSILGAFAKLRKATAGFVMPVRPSAWNNSTPTGRIFVKFDI